MSVVMTLSLFSGCNMNDVNEDIVIDEVVEALKVVFDCQSSDKETPNK